MRDRRRSFFFFCIRSFLISLNFYQTVLKLNPQMRFMFDIKKLVLIDVLKIFPKETQDNLFHENCNQFARISSNSQSKSHY